MKLASPRFSEEDAERAFDEWGANCGPGSIAAILGLTLDELRPAMLDFESKHYTNPTLMWAVLRGLRVDYSMHRPPTWPTVGLVRIQWEGPWTAPGVPPRVAYRHTHWIGAAIVSGSVGVFDINCINNGSGWVALTEWERIIVPHLVKDIPKASGDWSMTHSVEIRSRGGTE